MYIENYWIIPDCLSVEDWKLLGKRDEPLRIPSNWQINPFAPFLRPKIPYTVKNESKGKSIMVKGVKSLAKDSITKKQLGYCFFFDIDKKVDEDLLFSVLESLCIVHNLTHLIVTETLKGYHIWCLEFKKHKVGWFGLFMNLKHIYNSDYEFMSDWILRIGDKPNNPAPKFMEIVFNDPHYFPKMSDGHLLILHGYAKLPHRVMESLVSYCDWIPTFIDILEYRSWNFSP